MQRFVSYENFVANKLYLRWHTVRVVGQDYWSTFEELQEFETDVLTWCYENTKSQWAARNPHQYVCFQDRQDAMLFKLAFG